MNYEGASATTANSSFLLYPPLQCYIFKVIYFFFFYVNTNCIFFFLKKLITNIFYCWGYGKRSEYFFLFFILYNLGSLTHAFSFLFAHQRAAGAAQYQQLRPKKNRGDIFADFSCNSSALALKRDAEFKVPCVLCNSGKNN